MKGERKLACLPEAPKEEGYSPRKLWYPTCPYQMLLKAVSKLRPLAAKPASRWPFSYLKDRYQAARLISCRQLIALFGGASAGPACTTHVLHVHRGEHNLPWLHFIFIYSTKWRNGQCFLQPPLLGERTLSLEVWELVWGKLDLEVYPHGALTPSLGCLRKVTRFASFIFSLL